MEVKFKQGLFEGMTDKSVSRPLYRNDVINNSITDNDIVEISTKPIKKVNILQGC